MTMLGIISLAGIVVNNSVVLIDYTQLLLTEKAKLNPKKIICYLKMKFSSLLLKVEKQD